jgi:hypothetical protein
MLNSALPSALIYKRTHPGDPDGLGRFGNEDCMGRVRDYRYDFVIGVGGTSSEPRSHCLDRKINWVGRWPKRRDHPMPGARADLIEFAPGDYVVMEERGPLLQSLSQMLATRVFGTRNRFLNGSLSLVERREAARVVNKILANPVQYGARGAGRNAVGRSNEHGPLGAETICRPRRCSRRSPPPRAGGC